MKYLISIAIAMSTFYFSNAQLKAPSLSPKYESTQKVGLTELGLKYWRPSKRNRSIFATNGLVPLGTYWRTGANGLTTLSFSTEVNIAGTKLKKGDYTILSIIDDKTWTISIYPWAKESWTYFKDKAPLVKIPLNINKSKRPEETLFIGYKDLTFDSATLRIAWDYIYVDLLVELPTQELMKDKMGQVFAGPSIDEYYQSAVYLLDTKTDLSKALEYIQNVTKRDDAKFFHVMREMQILEALERYPEAVKVAHRTKKLAQEAGFTGVVDIAENLISKYQ